MQGTELRAIFGDTEPSENLRKAMDAITRKMHIYT